MRAAPTHGWLIGNNVMRWLASLFILVLLILFIIVWTVTYTIRRDCQHPYHRDLKLAGYWLHIQAGSTKHDCPAI